ncbi:MAG: enoyl-CoA hydratase/isomerase family protein [Parasphingopyxis sp.]|uniref:enoyl-CoA hydratase/isomerase family protein n=1 Tax=Parasphingopyxis sp. TaxID=1920299 RepID=UPI0032ED7FF9
MTEPAPQQDYGFRHVLIDYPAPGVVLLTLNRPDRHNAANAMLHEELSHIPARIDADGGARVAVVTGAGKAFCVGGDYADIAAGTDDFTYKLNGMRETLQLVSSIVDMRKPIISAINGPAAGAGLALALLADISVANEEANLSDGHTKIGLAAGDHAALIWPLLCSLAKAKRYLLTADKISGREAERIGLVSEAASPDQVLPRALELAEQLAALSPLAVELTKRSLNSWLRQAMPSFESSLGYEMLTTFSPDHLAAMSGKDR